MGNRDVERTSLTTLLARDPRHREARLRRALLASREGEERRAEETLGGLAREPQNDWITSLAYQELGRLLLERREYARAITLLAEGSARLPEDQPLLTALAYGYERAGRISALRATLARLQPRPAAGMTPRQRISQAPAAELAELRQALLAAALLRQGELAGALPGAAARSGG